MRSRALVCCLGLLAGGCGYVGEPLPPLLNIPERVTDLRALQRGGRIMVDFTLPLLTTEGTVLKEPPRAELRAGEGNSPDAWSPAAHTFDAAPWVGKEIGVAVKVLGPSGRDAGWSDIVRLRVVAPMVPPAEVRAEAVPEGVRVSWRGAAPAYRVFRGAEEQPAATTDQLQWVDASTDFGKTYRYRVQAVNGANESDFSPEVAVTPIDRFPPAVPAGLRAVRGTASIELAWEPNGEADFAAYRVYRDGGHLAETPQPAYSDRKIQPGKIYKYTVASVDKLGNESRASEPVEVAAP